MLTSIFRTVIKNPIKKSFDITFMENKKFVKTLITFFIIFSYKLSLIGFLTNTLKALVSMILIMIFTLMDTPKRLGLISGNFSKFDQLSL